MGKTVLYARVSSKEQEEEGYSIPAQLRFLRDYARNRKWQILQEFVDVETAKKTGRKQFGKMVYFLRKNPNCRKLLVEKNGSALPEFPRLCDFGRFGY